MFCLWGCYAHNWWACYILGSSLEKDVKRKMSCLEVFSRTEPSSLEKCILVSDGKICVFLLWPQALMSWKIGLSLAQKYFISSLYFKGNKMVFLTHCTEKKQHSFSSGLLLLVASKEISKSKKPLLDIHNYVNMHCLLEKFDSLGYSSYLHILYFVLAISKPPRKHQFNW